MILGTDCKVSKLCSPFLNYLLYPYLIRIASFVSVVEIDCCYWRNAIILNFYNEKLYSKIE